MDVKNAIQKRCSIRAFTDEPVSKETLEQVLRLAARAVSAMNSQPWEFAVVTGGVLDRIREDNIDCLRNKLPADIQFSAMTGIYRRRGIDVAKQLFSAMDIAREDVEKRNWWNERGYRYFDAPAAVILYTDASLESERTRFDMGCVVQNLCVAAMEYGLGTCVAYQSVTYERGLRKYLHIPENKRLICGVAIGYPDWDFPANRVVSERAELDETVTWHGF